MRLKGRWIPDRKVTRVPAKIREVDCGMGMTELKKELEVFTWTPAKYVPEPQPAWKKPLIVGSLMAAAVSIGLGLTFAGSGAGLLMLVSGMCWMSIVIAANSTERKDRRPESFTAGRRRKRYETHSDHL